MDNRILELLNSVLARRTCFGPFLFMMVDGEKFTNPDRLQ